MTKLRLYFALFFILLALPIAVLLRHTYSNLEEEAFYFYRKTAESLAANFRQSLQQGLLSEEQRPYTHYRYIHVADRPVPQQEGLNLSPLASFPVQSEIPGILGYYQIDPDGSFHSPLLPDGSAHSEVLVPQREERERVRDKLASLLEDRAFHPSVSLGADETDRQLKESFDQQTNLSTLKRNLESNVDLTLEREYEQKDTSQYSPVGLREEEEKVASSGYSKRRVQKTSAKQALVFDSKLEDAYPENLRKEKIQSARAGRSDFMGNRSSEREENRRATVADDLTASRDSDASRGLELQAEVDPFRSRLIDGQWLVFYRKVWWHDRRYIQGFVASLSEFVDAQLSTIFQNSALPYTASYLLFYQGEIVQPAASGSTADRKPSLLYESVLTPPLSDFHFAVTVQGLPVGPGYQIVNLLAIFLSLLFIGGFAGIYRLTVTQMELSQKKSDFVSAVSHELKTPLTAIRMYGEMLMEGWVEDEKKQRYYQHIHDESERLSRLIQNVLTLAQLERKEWQFSLTAESPVELVNAIVDRLSSQIYRAGFEVTTIREGEARPIQVDSDAMTQIMINLIDNAIKFSKGAETKQIVLTISQVGSDCYIRIRDYGPGIPRRKLKRIFEKFYRIDSEMTRTTRGTGIGLSLVKMLADAMGAHVDVVNRRPGTEFSIRFTTKSGTHAEY